MKVLIMGLLFVSNLLAEDINLTENINFKNKCDALANIQYKLVLKSKSEWNQERYGFQYGFKNDSNKTVKVKIVLNYKDDKNNTIADFTNTETLKAHYTEPMEKGRYYPKDTIEVGKDFSGLTELTFSCETKKEETSNKFKELVIPMKLWEAFKEKHKSEFAARLRLLELIVKDIKQ